MSNTPFDPKNPPKLSDIVWTKGPRQRREPQPERPAVQPITKPPYGPGQCPPLSVIWEKQRKDET